MGALTKKEIAEAVSEELGFSVRVSKKLVNETFEIMKEALKNNEPVKIVRFGSFSCVTKKARQITNPLTGQRIMIPERTKVVFHPSRILKGIVNAREDKEILQNRGSK